MSMSRFSPVINAAVIFILLLASVQSVGLPAASPLPAAAPTGRTTDDSQTPIEAKLVIDHYPIQGEPARLTCTVTTVEDAQGSTAQIELPPGARLLTGDLTWSGDLHPGQPVQLSASVAFDQLGDTSVFCRAHYQIDEENSWGDLGQLYFNVGQTQGVEGFSNISALKRVSNGAQRTAGNGTPVPDAISPAYAPTSSAPPPPSVDPILPGAEQPARVDAPEGTLVVTGSWHYYDRNDAYVGADQMLVELVRGDTGAFLAWCWTNNSGSYTCPAITNPGSAGVRTYIRSWTSFNPNPDILAVENPDWSTATPAPIDATFSVQTGVETFADGTGDLGSWFVNNGDTYERAYWIVADLERAWKYVFFNVGEYEDPVETSGPGTVQWKISSTDGTYYSYGGNIHLDGADPLSDTTVNHEYGHNIMWTAYGAWFPTNDCPSPHYIQHADAPHCGWTEGWGDFFTLAINNDPVYRWADGGTLNLETPTWGTSTWENGDWGEGRVAGALWDILDTANDGDDTYTDGTFVNIWDTFYHTYRISTFRPYWDSWVARGHNNTSAGPIMDLYQNTINYRSGPTNDDFSGRFALSGSTSSTAESTTNATTQGLDPATTCGSTTTPRQSRSVWFSFNPTISRQYFLNTTDSGYDTVLAIWTGSWGSFTSTGCSDNYGGTVQSGLTRGLTHGTTYYIEAMRFGNGVGGPLNFAVCYAPDIPALSGPADDTYSSDNTPTFIWTTTYIPDSTQIQISTNNAMTGIVVDTTTTNAYYIPVSALAEGNYYWRVRGKYTGGCANDGTWSTIRHLVVDTVEPTGSIVINGGNTYTTSATVTLGLSATDSTSGMYQMRIGNDGDFYGPWEAYGTSKSWALIAAGVDGSKGVWVTYRDHALNPSAQYVDHIILDTTAPTNPTSAAEAGGAANNTWQNTVPDPNFTWSGASDATSGVGGYYVYWGSDPAGTGATWVTTAAYNPAAVANPSTNYLRVQTKDNAGNPAAWVTLFTFKYDTVAPTNPTPTSSSHTLSAWFSDPTVDVSWSGAADGSGSGVHGYSFEWSQSAGAIPDTVEDTTGATNTSPSLTTANNWYLHVRTRDNAGNWNAGAAHLGPFWIDVSAPANPTSVTETGGAANNTWQNTLSDPSFTWSGASDAASGLAGYYVYWGTNPAGTSSTWVTTAAYNPAAVANPSTNYLRVQTKDNVGNLAAWATLFTFKYDADPPTNPTPASSSHTLSAWSGDPTVDATWSGAADGAGSGVHGYSFQWSQSAGTIPDNVEDTTGATNTSSALATANNWYFHIRTRDSAGNWNASAAHLGPFWIDVTAPANPTAASELGGSANNTWQNTIPDPNFTWSGASDAASGVAGYYIYWGANPAGTGATWVTAAAYNPAAAANPSTNYLRVQTKDNAGNTSPWVTLFTFKYDGAPPVTTVTPLPATSTGFSITLDWSAADPGAGSGVTTYDVQYRVGASGAWTDWVTATAATSATLGPTAPFHLVQGETYSFRVRARDAAGNVESWPGGATFTMVKYTQVFLPIIVK